MPHDVLFPLQYCFHSLIQLFVEHLLCAMGFPDGASGKETTANAEEIRDVGSIPGLGRSPGGGHGNPLWYSCLENPMDREVWWATVHSVTKSQTRLKRLSTHALVCTKNCLESWGHSNKSRTLSSQSLYSWGLFGGSHYSASRKPSIHTWTWSALPGTWHPRCS